jgi:hypothetical protein
MHFKHGPGPMPKRTMFPRFYAIFRWPPKNVKWGVYSVCMHAQCHTVMCACVHMRVHTHTHTHTHRKSVGSSSGVQSVIQEKHKCTKCLFQFSWKQKTSLLVQNNFSLIIWLVLMLQACNIHFRFADIYFYQYSKNICKPNLA